ncbi:hypothetical protein, partial [Candidatus Frankia alpina]|uniref:hypothetical protein n=1 Tax=Candidatus Frankia alpina TaxID=2699483 RepID=UPI0019680180
THTPQQLPNLTNRRREWLSASSSAFGSGAGRKGGTRRRDSDYPFVGRASYCRSGAGGSTAGERSP